MLGYRLRPLGVSISNDALTPACDADDGEVELRCDGCVVDSRVDALVATVSAEHSRSFPSKMAAAFSAKKAKTAALLLTKPLLHERRSQRNLDASGEIDSMDLLAGQCVGLVREVKPAGQIVSELVAEAKQIISAFSC